MKVLVLAGSPRKGGNTDILADEFLKGAKGQGADVEKVYLDDYCIRPIGPVGDVPAKRRDVRSGDDFLKVFKRFLAADIVCFATPVYWQGVTAQTKCFMDRLSAYKFRAAYSKKVAAKGYAVITAFGGPGQGRWVTAPLKEGIEYSQGKYLGDLRVVAYRKGEVRKNARALKAAFALGAKAVKAFSRAKR
jgi:multimeric flavodoxin WrbA